MQEIVHREFQYKTINILSPFFQLQHCQAVTQTASSWGLSFAAKWRKMPLSLFARHYAMGSSRRKVDEPVHQCVVAGVPIDLGTWPYPDEGAIAEEKRAQYFERKAAVVLYVEGASTRIIEKRCHISRRRVYEIIRTRCLDTHPDGQCYGWRALVGGQHIHGYKRKCPVNVDVFGRGASGALALLIAQEPELAAKFERRVLKPPPSDRLGPVKVSAVDHWYWLLGELRCRGYEINRKWPFNTKDCGYWSIYRWTKAILAAHPRQAAMVTGGENLQRKMKSGDGVERPIDHFLQRVEMDAHKLDGRFCVMMPDPAGGMIPRIIYRLWVIVLIEVTSRVALGYHLSLGREVSQNDVLRAIKHALSKWTPMELTYPGLRYEPGAGFPSSVNPHWQGLCWDETSVDGALAEVCQRVKTALKQVVGSELLSPKDSFAVRRSLDDRPNIETFFRNLASGCFQKLSNSTGSSPTTKLVPDPAKVALASQFQYEYAEELLDTVIANYNAKLHHSLHRSPLKMWEFLCSRGERPLRRADPNTVNGLLSLRKLCTVHGGYEQGRAPYVHFENATYSGQMLDTRHDLVGKKVWVINHIENDARYALCTTVDGASLGVLRAAPPWHTLPHSVEVRKQICAVLRRSSISPAGGRGGVETFIEYVEKERNKKLPVHPAYLRLCRILRAAGESLDQRMLDAAQRQEASDVERGSPKRNAPIEGRKAPVLPPRRKASVGR